jgi:uncharacterized protein YprB with RNaseH-like and TPR domain
MKKQTAKRSKSVYLDCEWFHTNQKIFILGYCYDETNVYLMYDRSLAKSNIEKMLSGVDTIYFYGPDIAMIEKNFRMNLRENYNCVNLLPLFRHHAPRVKSHKLADWEKRAGIERETLRYKSNIWNLYDDWNDPKKKKRCLQYNADDVINLLRVKKWFFKKYGLTKRDALGFCL